MNYFLPRRHTNKGLGFSTPISLFSGISLLTHQPSPWIGDYAWCLITPITGKIASSDLFRRQSSYSMKKLFPAHYLRIFSERYQIQSGAGSKSYGAVMRFRAPEKLTLCFHAAKELEDLTLTDQTCHFHILDQAHTADTFYSLFLQWQFSQPIENVILYRSRSFLTFSSNEVTVQLGNFLSVPRHGSQPSSQPFLEEAKRSSRSMESAAKTN